MLSRNDVVVGRHTLLPVTQRHSSVPNYGLDRYDSQVAHDLRSQGYGDGLQFSPKAPRFLRYGAALSVARCRMLRVLGS